MSVSWSFDDSRADVWKADFNPQPPQPPLYIHNESKEVLEWMSQSNGTAAGRGLFPELTTVFAKMAAKLKNASSILPLDISKDCIEVQGILIDLEIVFHNQPPAIWPTFSPPPRPLLPPSNLPLPSKLMPIPSPQTPKTLLDLQINRGFDLSNAWKAKLETYDLNFELRLDVSREQFIPEDEATEISCLFIVAMTPGWTDQCLGVCHVVYLDFSCSNGRRVLLQGWVCLR